MYAWELFFVFFLAGAVPSLLGLRRGTDAEQRDGWRPLFLSTGGRRLPMLRD